MILIYKILRISAWLLVFATIFSLLSGFLAAKYFLAAGLGYSLPNYFHTIIIPLLFVPLFYIHSLNGMLLLFSRHKPLNKKSIKIIAGAFWTILFLVFGFLYFAKNPATNTAANNSAVGKNLSNSTSTANIPLTLEEISLHNKTGNCWMIISNKVYDLSNYLNAHPGGAGTILPYCGKDGTTAFETKNRGSSHSSNADNLLNSFYLGNFGQTISSQAVQRVRTQSQNIPVNTGEDYEED
jgi:cytochrome b involved in lipid metabolism